MIKIRIKNKPDYVENKIKCKDYCELEVMVLLDTAMNILKKEFDLSDDAILKSLKEFKNNYKEEESE